MVSVFNMAASYATVVLFCLYIFLTRTEAKHKLNSFSEENGFSLSPSKESLRSKESNEMAEVEEKLRGKLNKAEKALKESLNQLMEAEVEIFLKEKFTHNKNKEESHGKKMKQKNRKEYCHAKALIYCGKITESAFLKAELEDVLDFSSRCEIKEQFLDCMTLMKAKSCKNLPDIDLTEDEFKNFRSWLMKQLQVATGCMLPIQH